MNPWLPLAAFAALSVWYHLVDAALMLRNHPESFGAHSFLFSVPYFVAMFAGLVEYALWWWLAPALMASRVATVLSVVGLLVAVMGDAVRKIAILTNPYGFTHDIRFLYIACGC
jgi:hypothetical protein